MPISPSESRSPPDNNDSVDPVLEEKRRKARERQRRKRARDKGLEVPSLQLMTNDDGLTPEERAKRDEKRRRARERQKRHRELVRSKRVQAAQSSTATDSSPNATLPASTSINITNVNTNIIPHPLKSPFTTHPETFLPFSPHHELPLNIQTLDAEVDIDDGPDMNDQLTPGSSQSNEQEYQYDTDLEPKSGAAPHPFRSNGDYLVTTLLTGSFDARVATLNAMSISEEEMGKLYNILTNTVNEWDRRRNRVTAGQQLLTADILRNFCGSRLDIPQNPLNTTHPVFIDDTSPILPAFNRSDVQTTVIPGTITQFNVPLNVTYPVNPTHGTHYHQSMPPPPAPATHPGQDSFHHHHAYPLQ